MFLLLFRTPIDAEYWLQMAREYEIRWQFPHCIGPFDRKHVRMKAPNKSGSVFYNYHGNISIVLMAIVSANYELGFVDMGMTLGSTSRYYLVNIHRTRKLKRQSV